MEEERVKEVYFKSLMIADLQNRTARVQLFEKGLNVVTSADNHVGKSSLLKSLYYTLGAEVDYDSVWDKQSKLYIATLAVGEKEYRVAMYNFDCLSQTVKVIHCNIGCRRERISSCTFFETIRCI